MDLKNIPEVLGFAGTAANSFVQEHVKEPIEGNDSLSGGGRKIIKLTSGCGQYRKDIYALNRLVSGAASPAVSIAG